MKRKKDLMIYAVAIFILMFLFLPLFDKETIERRHSIVSYIADKYNNTVSPIFGLVLCDDKNNVYIYEAEITVKEKINVAGEIFEVKTRKKICLAVVNNSKVYELKNEVCEKLC